MSETIWTEVEAISSVVTAFSVVVISGLAAFWAWYRDTERLKTYRFLNGFPLQTPDPVKGVLQVHGMEGFPNIGVTVVNGSLISCGIVGVGFDFGDQIFWFREPEIRDDNTSFEERHRQAAEEQFGGRGPVPLGRKRIDWPLQVPAKGRITIWAGQFDLSIMRGGGVRIDDIAHENTAAIVRTETGKAFRTRVTKFGKVCRKLQQSLNHAKTEKVPRFTFDVWNDDRGF
jgi:hypothetical protein